jgi:hypothetical protein
MNRLAEAVQRPPEPLGDQDCLVRYITKDSHILGNSITPEAFSDGSVDAGPTKGQPAALSHDAGKWIVGPQTGCAHYRQNHQPGDPDRRLLAYFTLSVQDYEPFTTCHKPEANIHPAATYNNAHCEVQPTPTGKSRGDSRKRAQERVRLAALVNNPSGSTLVVL